MIDLTQILTPLLWAGMIAGISFIEAPLKFRAPGITIPLGLGIGQLVFRTLNKVEWVFYILWCLPLFVTRHAIAAPFIPAVMGVLLLLQTIWWLPRLDKRARLIRQGQTPQGKSMHIFYASAEVVKCFLLVAYSCIYIIHYKM